MLAAPSHFLCCLNMIPAHRTTAPCYLLIFGDKQPSEVSDTDHQMINISYIFQVYRIICQKDQSPLELNVEKEKKEEQKCEKDRGNVLNELYIYCVPLKLSITCIAAMANKNVC